MDWILGRLACGSLADVDALPAAVTVVVNLSQHVSTAAVPVLHHEIPDEVWLDASVWSGLTHLLGGLLQRGDTALVHCRLGVSRAPALCAAYLMRCGMAPEEALAYVTARRALAAVHAETWRGVTQWAEGLRR